MDYKIWVGEVKIAYNKPIGNLFSSNSYSTKTPTYIVRVFQR